MDRHEAILKICSIRIKKLTQQERYDALLNWWWIDDENEIFSALSPELQNEIISNEEPPKNVESDIYNALIIESMKCKYVGVRNEYISEQISTVLGHNVIVEGEVEELYPCPCCSYRTLKERGRICPLCLWEDCGDDLDKYSGPNRMTLSEGQILFEGRDGRVFGDYTLSQVPLECVDFNDMKKRYYK